MHGMDSLQIELDRLYAPVADAEKSEGSEAGVRALVLALTRPSGWPQLADIWRGAQQDLDLPAPGIAVSGLDGMQLWFSLAAPVEPSRGVAFLKGLRRRYLGQVKSAEVHLLVGAAMLPPAPPVHTGPDRWSAFVAADLAAVFDETPWLDLPPSSEGQAALLRELASIPIATFELALHRLGAIDMQMEASEALTSVPAASAPTPDLQEAEAEALSFLRRVMNDETAPLELRVEAAKAMLAHRGRGY